MVRKPNRSQTSCRSQWFPAPVLTNVFTFTRRAGRLRCLLRLPLASGSRWPQFWSFIGIVSQLMPRGSEAEAVYREHSDLYPKNTVRTNSRLR